jgi:hypothetical protein
MSYPLVRVDGMDGENPSGADNQQERPSSNSWLALIPEDLGQYLAGFADGEGSFNICFRPRKDHRMPWKVTMTFNISQRNVEVLELFKEVLECGNLWRRRDGVWYFETRSHPRIVERVIPFFQQFPIRSSKANDFAIFCRVADLMSQGAHLTRDGIIEIVHLRNPMNRGGKRRYSDQMILDSLRLEESSEAIRQALPDLPA